MARPLQVYETADVTVTFDPQRCIHNGHCVRTLPEVFDTAARPWVQPANADAATVMQVVAGCPTGALHATARDGASADAPLEEAPLNLRVARHGPLFLRGGITVVNADGSTLVSDARVALCRCGLSQRKPFCDNSHRAAGWRDTQVPGNGQP
ncbi:MAG: (4Fe-4S)-binding protein [Gemmatimonadota bacterium]